MSTTHQQVLTCIPKQQDQIIKVTQQQVITSISKKQDQIMRTDLQQSLTRHHINPSELSTFQRLILTTDGTLTDILEAYMLEEVQVIKLSEELVSITHDILPMKLNKGTEVIARNILLRGRISRKNLVYAESIIVPERLDETYRDELLKTKTPLSQIWLEQRIETFKEILDSGKEPAKGLSSYFNIEPDENMLFRTYAVFSNRKSTMMITEKFPESYFTKGL